MTTDALEISRRIIAHHSKSFSLASRLLPPAARDRAVVVYAWCRRADDAVDMAALEPGRRALATLREELDAVYSNARLDDDILAAFQQVTRTCRIPKSYPHELLEGCAMDVEETHYDGMPRLLRYCFRVAGTVGLMMCHVMGIRNAAATTNAAHLGAAMQLTNICRDVSEDWGRNRLYLPDDLLERHGCAWLSERLGEAFPDEARRPVSNAIRELLEIADVYYGSGDAGIPSLTWRCGVAVRSARHIYAAIGDRIRAQDCDPLAGRAWVSGPRKVGLAARAMLAAVPQAGAAMFQSDPRVFPPDAVVRAEDVFDLCSARFGHDACARVSAAL